MLEAHYIGEIDFDSNLEINQNYRPLVALAHFVTIMRCFIKVVAEVHAFGNISSAARARGVTSFDIYTVNVISKNGEISKLTVHCSEKTPAGDSVLRCKLCGTKGTSIATYPDLSYIQHIHNQDPLKVEFLNQENVEFYFSKKEKDQKPIIQYGCYANYIGHFARAIASQQPDKTKINFVQGLQTLVIIEAIRRSAVEKRPIKVKDIRNELFGESMRQDK